MNFVAENLQAHFTQFVLPFSVTLIYEIEKQRILPGNNIITKAKVNFIQNDLTLGTVFFKSKVFSKQFLIEKENSFVSTYLNSKEIEQKNQHNDFQKMVVHYA